MSFTCTKFAALAAFAAVALAGCGGGGEPKASQVAAKVNRDEITVHQVNQAMQRLGNVSQAQAQQAQKQILERLIDQQLLVQQAIDKKLDRDPRVVQTIEAARRQILARAYVEQVTGSATKAPEDRIKEFYAEHPELFKERRVYRFAQITVAAPADKQAELRDKLTELEKLPDKARILPQFVQWLKSQNLQFRVTEATQGAEQLPLEDLPKFQKMNVGDLTLAPGLQGVVVAQLTAVQNQPLNEEQAKPYIEQYLQQRERAKLSDEEMKRLRAAAKIEYVGEFAKLQQQPSGTTPPGGAAAPPADAQAPAPANQDGSSEDEAIAKGLKGLK